MNQNQTMRAWAYGIAAFAVIMFFWWWQGGSILPQLAGAPQGPTPQERTVDFMAAMVREGWTNAAAMVRMVIPK